MLQIQGLTFLNEVLVSIFNWVTIRTDIMDWQCSKVWKSTSGTACFTCLLFTLSFFSLLYVQHNPERSMQFHGTRCSKLYFSSLSQFLCPFLLPSPLLRTQSLPPSHPPLSLGLPHWSVRVNHLNILGRFHKTHIKTAAGDSSTCQMV